jgi:hypothetical protein
MASAQSWFYASGGNKLKATVPELKALYQQKTITNDTLVIDLRAFLLSSPITDCSTLARKVWRDGLPNWAKVSAVPELLNAFGAGSAAAPPPASSPPPAASPKTPSSGSGGVGAWLYVDSTGQQAQTSAEKLKAMVLLALSAISPLSIKSNFLSSQHN